MSEESAFEVGRLYEPIKRIADTLTASQKDIFVRLPGLVVYYPMGIRSLGDVVEHGGSGLILRETGSCPTDYDGNAYVHLGDGTNYLDSASATLGITGTEAFISSGLRGLTLGGWFMLDDFPASQGGLITKFGAVTQYGYAMAARSTEDLAFEISSNGSAIFYVESPPVSVSQWYFFAARYTPSVEISIFVNGVKTTNSTAIPASIHASTQEFEVGRYLADNSKIVHGRVRDVFVCAASLSDQLIEEVRATSVP